MDFSNCINILSFDSTIREELEFFLIIVTWVLTLVISVFVAQCADHNVTIRKTVRSVRKGNSMLV